MPGGARPAEPTRTVRVGRLMAYLDRIVSDAGRARAELLAAKPSQPSKPTGKAGDTTLATIVRRALSNGGQK